jgi:hypothetical protein
MLIANLALFPILNGENSLVYCFESQLMDSKLRI